MASRVAEGASKEDEEGKFYDAEDKKRFRGYFIKPPVKRGRPTKKKNTRGRPSKKAKQPSQSRMVHDLTTDGDGSVDLVPKDKDDLDARLEGMLARAKRDSDSKQKRTNWDTPVNAALRERIARSWINKNDFYKKGESFVKFCTRCGISRTVLLRFLQKPKDNDGQSKNRGRPSFLTEDQMRHICEGLLGAWSALWQHCGLHCFVNEF
jgi:hypothetical protein